MNLATERAAQKAWLVPVAGPSIKTIELIDRSRPLLVGRLEHSDIRLPVDSVSRSHARIRFDSARWRITDLKSRWGTFINGVAISSERDVPLDEGDLLRITPWTFRFSAAPLTQTGLLEGAMDSVDDMADARGSVRTVTAESVPSLGDEMLKLLLESANGIHAALDEKSLAETILEKACQGSGLPNAAVLKPAGTGGRFEIISSRFPRGSGPIAYSRSLLMAASDGNVAELSADQPNFDVSQSIVSLGVRSALCVPLMVGQTVAAYLYLDSRGDPSSGLRLPLRPHASAFCLALGRMAGLALANLKRINIERRTAHIEADLSAASAAQQWILPKRAGSFGRFAYTGQSRAGEYLGGDFYAIIPLEDHRLAVAIGDVSGHGVAASVLMTASTGFLHAVLHQATDAADAVNRLNRFICPRKPAERFVTLWVAILDVQRQTLQYVDAGHGYALLGPAAGDLTPLPPGENYPMGICESYEYKTTTVPLAPAGRLLLISDGLVEQFGPATANDQLNPFGMEGLRRTVQTVTSGADLIGSLFDAVIRHAGQSELSDDATAVLVKW